MKPMFYLHKTDQSGTIIGTKVSMEDHFQGLKYLSCSGLEARGEIKNIYTENYADYDGIRTFHPSDVGADIKRGSTEVKLALLFLGEGRRATYESFLNYIASGRFYWWDTVRHKKAWLLHKESSAPQEDVVKGEPYIKVEFTFTNIWGETRSCNDNGQTA